MSAFAKEACAFMDGVSFDQFEGDRLLQLAITRLVELIGEAASNVSADCKLLVPEIPWAVIVKTRNKLIHHYFGVKLDIVYEVAKQDRPDLINQLAVALDRLDSPRN